MTTLPTIPFDLRSAFPSNWSPVGFGPPLWDGNNHYRLIQASQGHLTFTLASPQFVQLTYQPHSPDTDVAVSLAVDGAHVQTTRHFHNQFHTVQFSDALAAGRHTLSFRWSCAGQPCPVNTVRVYELRGIQAPTPAARLPMSFSEQQYALLAPDIPFSFIGISRVEYDGNTLMRLLKNDARLTYRGDGSLVLLKATLFSERDTTVKLSVPGLPFQVMQLPAKQFVPVAINLRGARDPQLTFGITCADPTCAPIRVYQPKMVVRTAQSGFASLNLGMQAGLLLLVSLLLFALWQLLAPWTRRERTVIPRDL